MKRAIRRAIKEAGGQSALGRACGVSQEAVRRWLERGQVPAERLVAIETATGVPREELRPKLYKRARRIAAA